MLSEQKKRFVDEYLVDDNATEAAKRAGYSAKTAYSMGSRLLKTVEIQNLLEKRRASHARRVDLSCEWVLRRLMAIANTNMSRLATWNESGVTWKSKDEMTEEESYAISEITQTMNESGGTTKIKVHDKTKALELLGKQVGMFTGKPEESSEDLRNMTTEQLIDSLKDMQ